MRSPLTPFTDGILYARWTRSLGVAVHLEGCFDKFSLKNMLVGGPEVVSRRAATWCSLRDECGPSTAHA